MISAVVVLLIVFAIGFLFQSPALIAAACLAALLLPTHLSVLVLGAVGVTVVIYLHNR